MTPPLTVVPKPGPPGRPSRPELASARGVWAATPPAVESCSWCSGGHLTLTAAIACASGHVSRRTLYAWAERQDDITTAEVKQLLGRLTSVLGHNQAIRAAEAVIAAGWRPTDGDDTR